MMPSVAHALRRVPHLRGYGLEAYRWISTYARLYGVERRNPVIVFQMGKVGSSTVVDALEASGCGPVLHVHTLTGEELGRAVARQRGSAAPYLHEHLITSSVLLRKLKDGLFPCRIITLTREPVARAVSHVFEDNRKKMEQVRQRHGAFTAADVMAVVTDLLRTDNGIADPTRWFDRELRAVTGVDVFARPFDADRGYTIFESSPAPVLLLRMEDLDRALRPALADFLGVDPASVLVGRRNVGAQTWYAELLQEVKNTYRLPEPLAERVYGTRYVRHFYGEEAVAMRSRWTIRDEASS